MKYFKVFNTSQEYYEYLESDDFISPNVSTLRDSTNTWINPETHDYSKDYFTIESLEDNNEIKFGRSVGGGNITELHIAASTDNGSTWTEYTLPYENGQYEIATINSGDKIIFKYISGGFKREALTNTYFVTSGSFNVYGNVMSLVKAGNFSDATTNYGVPFLLKNSKVVSAKNLIFPKNASLDTSSHYGMFSGCTSLIEAPELPATTLANACYRSMFDGCTSLIEAPELPATTLVNECYRSMFGNCTNLEEAPELPATTLANHCYHYMFGSCTSLTEAPELPATTLATYCYYQMFYGCTSLTTALELPATTLPDAGYCGMFSGCTSLTTAPIISATTIGTSGCADMFASCSSLTTVQNTLPATTLANNCYYRMFHSCSELTTGPELPATTLANNCYREMFRGCNSLTTAPIILATTLANNCCMEMFRDCLLLTTVQSELSATTMATSAYTRMFYYCNSLTTAPTLPATTLANGCYDGTFQHCIALTTVQNILPATTLVERCYIDMFRDCWALPTAPELPATTLFEKSYKEMFMNCNKLNYIKCLATDINATECTMYWVKSVASSGTFVKNSLMENWTTGNNGIPTNWTVHNDTYVEVTGVTISASAATVNKGNTCTLTASVLPSNADDQVVSWSTSDSSVATVSNGVVTGVGCGNVTITVKTHEKGYTATCDMSVENHVTSVDLDVYQLYLGSGGTYQLEATVLPSDACDKSVTWASNNTNIATVDYNGLVSGVTIGEAVVTVTTVDGGLTKNCSVTVNEGQHATGVTLSDAAITVNKDETYALTATVLPNDAIDKSVTWSSSDGSIATVDSNGVVSGVASGDTTITVTTVDGGFTAQCSVSVTNIHDYSKDYFTIESLQDSNTITVVKGGANVNLSYSLDNGETWNTQTLSGTITIGTINTSEKIIFKASANKWGTAWNAYNRFNGSKQFKVYGNAMSLLNGDGFVNNSEFATGSSFNLVGLFYGTTTVIDASDLILPATTLYESSYNGMFRGCTNLVNGPKLLPALVVPKDGYSSFFEGCINLVGVPEIMATTVRGDTALNRMFCADRNKEKDTPLTKGPVLRVTNPSAYTNVYQQLFSGHGNLNEVTIHAEGTNLSFTNWLNNVSSSGVIKKLSATTLTNNSVNGKPSGWTTEDID